MNVHVRSRFLRAALAAVAGLVLAGCGTAATTSGPSSAAATSSSAATSTTSPGSGGLISAASLPFPVAVGNTWVYHSTVPSVGTTSTLTDKILAVTPVAGGSRVTESYHNNLSSSTAHTVFIFHSDGSITFPLSQVSGGTLTSSSGGILLPDAAAIASGRPYRSVLKLGFTEDGKRVLETAHVTVQGAGTATVTVPAGTYQATIVDMTMAWSVATITVTIEIKDWVANGTGTVKSEASIHEGVLNEIVSTEELTSFTKG